MEKSFEHRSREEFWYQYWQKNNVFSSELGSKEYTFCLMLPPPNVTGSLHMGHAFQDTLMDILVRSKAQNEYRVLWQVGTDHAGIATQMVVDRLLESQGADLNHLSREQRLDAIWQWKEESGGKILSQLKRLGTFMDWSKERFTLDTEYTQAVTHAFVTLYRDGLIYKKKRLVNWDCKLQSAVSDLEVDHIEKEGFLYSIEYKNSENPSISIEVQTTRPETVFGDVAIAVHPDDHRYQHLIGKSFTLSILNREIPLIADPRIDTSFGSGAVKITPAHDFFDFEIAQSHGLELINILNSDGTLNEQAYHFSGLDRIAARQHVVDALTEGGHFKGITKHLSSLPYCSRTGERIEPYLTDQWYISMKPLAQRALQAFYNKEFVFVPESWGIQYEQWLSDIQDWCISRQLIWGHRIPVWSDQQGNLYCGSSESEVRDFYNIDSFTELKQDPDVLDTWFSSALWPFATLGWPSQTFDPEKHPFFPNNTLVSGFDIIFFWVARMIMFSLYFTKKVPFHHVYLHGIIQDAQGQKMSKSKGNVIDPIDLIDGISLEDLIGKRTSGLMQPEKAVQIAKQTQKDYPDGFPSFGVDALRMTFARQASPGRFLRFDIDAIKIEQQTCHKLWNLVKFALPYMQDAPVIASPKHPVNQWAMQVLNNCKKLSDKHLEEYRFDLYIKTLVETMWDQICDHYIETIKVLIKDPDFETESAVVLCQVIKGLVFLLHPVIPFITEELSWIIHQTLSPNDTYSVLARQKMPCIFHAVPSLTESDEHLSSVMSSFFKFLSSLRTLRSKMNLSPKESYRCLTTKETFLNFSQYRSILKHMAKIDLEIYAEQDDHHPDMALLEGVDGSFSYFLSVPKKDLEEQKERLSLEIKRIKNQIEPLEIRLNDQSFLKNAPQKVLEKDRLKLQDFHAALKAAIQSYEALAGSKNGESAQ